VIRRYALAGEIEPSRGFQVLEDLVDLPLTRYSHELLLSRIWELQHNLTAYDAAYLALAEALAAPLLTRDARLASFRDHSARIELV
jgi:predicted nucleic acid-binding protein